MTRPFERSFENISHLLNYKYRQEIFPHGNLRGPFLAQKRVNNKEGHEIDARPLQPSRLNLCVCVLEIQWWLGKHNHHFQENVYKYHHAPKIEINEAVSMEILGSVLGARLGFVTIHLFVIETRDGKGHFTLESLRTLDP